MSFALTISLAMQSLLFGDIGALPTPLPDPLVPNDDYMEWDDGTDMQWDDDTVMEW